MGIAKYSNRGYDSFLKSIDETGDPPSIPCVAPCGGAFCAKRVKGDLHRVITQSNKSQEHTLLLKQAMVSITHVTCATYFANEKHSY